MISKCENCKKIWHDLPKVFTIFNQDKSGAMNGIYFNCDCDTTLFIPQEDAIVIIAAEKYGYRQGALMLDDILENRYNSEALEWARMDFMNGGFLSTTNTSSR